MKNLLKLGMALLIAAILIGFVGCFDKDDEGEGDVDFKNYTGASRAIAFRNKSDSNVVLFGKSLSAGNILGGVEKGTINGSGISKANNSKFFSTTQAFEVIAITEAQYNKNKDNLSKIEYPLTKFYVFWNKDGTNENIYDIDERLGGSQYFITIVLPQKNGWNVELRNGGRGGAAVGYAAQGIQETRLYVQPDKNLNFAPIFHRWNSFMEVLEEAYPKNDEGADVIINVRLSSDYPEFTINMKEIMEGIDSQPPQLGAAYVIIQVTATGGMVQLTRNGTPIRTPLGASYFTGSKTFEIKMTKPLSGAEQYAESESFNGYAIGPQGSEKAVQFKKDGTDLIEASVANGKIYILTAMGGNLATSPGSMVNTLYLDTEGDKKVTEFNYDKMIGAK